MTLYTVRTGFSVFKNGLVYTAGQSVDLTLTEFAQNKHKLENTQSTVVQGIYNPVNSGSAADVSFDDLAADLLPSADTGSVQAVIEEIDRRLDAITLVNLKSYKTTFSQGDLQGNSYTVNHQLNSLVVSTTIFNESGEQIKPDRVTRVDANTISIDLDSYAPLSNTYSLLIYG